MYDIIFLNITLDEYYINKKKKKNEITLFTDNKKILDEIKFYHTMKYDKNIKCWHCTYNFDNNRIGIPISVENNVYHMYGTFCSYQCALAYLISSENIIENKNISLSLIKKIYNTLFNQKLFPAPHRIILIDYGGNINIDEFRKSSEFYSDIDSFFVPLLIKKK